MKPDYLANPVTRSSEDPDEMTMTIDKESVAHILHIIRSQLYSDKIGSPIREYASNAVDAHVEAGLADLPIEVHLPHQLDPYFRVVDRGAGLTEGEMDKIFRRFGKSTKRESNNQIGCLGIGAKSAFAYQDSFMVVSHTVRGNFRSIVKYSVYLDESRLGKITVLDRQENPEGRTGLAVEIPVKPDDFHAFREGVATQLRFFTPAPTCLHGGEPANMGWTAPYEVCPGVELDSSPRLIMGGVGYRVDSKQVRQYALTSVHGEVSDLAQERERGVQMILRMNLLVRVPIGTVEVEASREGLSYTRKTQRALVSRCRLAYRRLSRAMKQEVANLPTRADAFYCCRTLAGRYRIPFGFFPELTWHGKAIHPATELSLSTARHRTLDLPSGVFTIGVKWQLPVTYSSERKAEPTDRHFIPVLQDVLGRGGLCKIAERMHTLQTEYPAATFILYRVPKRLPTEVNSPVALQALYELFLREVVYCRAFQLDESEYTGLAFNQLLDLWADLGGIRLRDVQPTAFSQLRAVKGPNYKRYAKKPVSCSVISTGNTRRRRDQLESFLMTPALARPVVYWIVSCLGQARTGYETDTYKLVTRRHTAFHLEEAVFYLEATYGVRCLLLETDLNRAAELKLPLGWQEGSDWLAAKLPGFPLLVRYYWVHVMPTRLVSNLGYIAKYLPDLQELQANQKLLGSDMQQAFKFLLQPRLTRCYQTIDRTQACSEYKALLAHLHTLQLTGPVNIPDPLARFPLLARLDPEDALVYVQLVLRTEQLQEQVNNLEAQVLSNQQPTSDEIKTAAEEDTEEPTEEPTEEAACQAG